MGEYDGVHAFLFVAWDDDPDPPTVIDAIRRRLGEPSPDGPLHFAAVLEEGSDFGGFAHFSAPNTDELGQLYAIDLWEAGVRSDSQTEGVVYPANSNAKQGPKRRSPRFAAICRTKVAGRRPLDVMNDIAEHWGSQDPFIGASQLLGRFHLLVELGENERPALDVHVAELRGIEGVARVKVGIADTGASSA